jgi:uncharacterized protein YecT (DUF1311 family)
VTSRTPRKFVPWIGIALLVALTASAARIASSESTSNLQSSGLSGIYSSSGYSDSSAGSTNSVGSTPGVTFDRSCETSAGSQIAMDECAQSEFAEVQSQLAPILRYDDSRLGAKTFSSDQRQWIALRSSFCALEANLYRGGTIRPLIFQNCEVMFTANRIAQLKQFNAAIPH